jgi:hypothetical protein
MEGYDHRRALAELRKALYESHEHLLKGICAAHDDGLTFQEIADALGRKGKGAIHHLYERGKAKGY